jgi:hypothetical protein
MATAAPPGGITAQQSDRQKLAEMLEEMQNALRRIVHDSRTPFAFQDQFIDTWDDVQNAFDVAIRRLRMPLVLFWLLFYPVRLRRVGLAGKMLEMKYSVWKKHIFDWGEPVAPYGSTSKVDPLLDYINTILGSAAKVFPLLEIPKEYKELLHTQLKLSRASSDD